VREPAGFQHGKMRGAAGGDPAAFDEVDPRGARLHATSLPLRSIVFTWPWTVSTRMGPLTAMDSPSMTPTASCAGVVGARMGGSEHPRRQASRWQRGTAQRGAGTQSSCRKPSPAILPGTAAESLAYTIRRLFRRRMKE